MDAAVFIHQQVYPHLFGTKNYGPKNDTVIIPMDVKFDRFSDFPVFTASNRAWMVVYLLNYAEKFHNLARYCDKNNVAPDAKGIPRRPEKARYIELKDNASTGPEAQDEFDKIEEIMGLHRAKWVDAHKGSMKNGSWDDAGMEKLKEITVIIQRHMADNEQQMREVEEALKKKLLELEKEANTDADGKQKKGKKSVQKVTVVRDQFYAGGLTDSEDEK